MKKFYKLFLGLIFILALATRFYEFKDSTYFGYDQAKDAFESQDIYLNKNIKIQGLPATGNMGIFHGPLHWYITGPIYLLFKGDPYGVSAFFRIANAAGVFLIYFIGSLLLNKGSGLIAAFIYAVSFEETQYSYYVGNPSLATIFIPLIYLGAVLLTKKIKNKNLPLILMFGGAAAATQLNLMYAYNFAVVITLLRLLRNHIVDIKLKNWVIGVGVSLTLLSTYVIAEIKYNFREIKTVYKLLNTGFGVMSPGQNKYLLYWDKFITMFKDNFFGIYENDLLITTTSIVLMIWVIYMATKKENYRILAVWIFSWVFLMLFGGHTGYYTNAGIGGGIILGVTSLILSIRKPVGKFLVAVTLSFILLSNIKKINIQAPKSLITEMITQTGMKLSDENKIIDQMYSEANGRGFTVRATSVPYKIQTVWAYLFNQYALPKYGYLPFWENGNALGFPGKLPVPTKGTTCLRFLLREPTKGLPGFLIELDEKEENKFSKITHKREIADFLLESRISTDKICHNDRP